MLCLYYLFAAAIAIVAALIMQRETHCAYQESDIRDDPSNRYTFALTKHRISSWFIGWEICGDMFIVL